MIFLCYFYTWCEREFFGETCQIFMVLGRQFILVLNIGVLQGWFWKLLHRLQAKKLVSVDFTWIDSTTVSIHRHGSGSLKKKEIKWFGLGRKGLTTKLHLALSTAGIQRACLSEAQCVDMKVFSKLWELGKWLGIRYVIANKRCDYFAVRTLIKKLKKLLLFQDEPMQLFQDFKISINPITVHILQ